VQSNIDASKLRRASFRRVFLPIASMASSVYRGGSSEPDNAPAMSDEAQDIDADSTSGRRRRGKKVQNLRDQDDIPRVRDETGERVRESFEAFLETCVVIAASGRN
jgi:hypothetical protein